ncbi:MAG: WD40 repeat domain-containing protein [Anaerolineae bacterium]|nr:WD40 repeat domain-containing protein [Anaerolineae bacterium]
MKRVWWAIAVLLAVMPASCGPGDDPGAQPPVHLEKVAEMTGHTRSVVEFAFAPPYLASLGDDGVRVWDLQSYEPVAAIAGGPGGVDIFFATADGEPAGLVLVRNDGTVERWSVPDGEPLNRFAGHGDLVGRAALAPDGVTLALGGRDGQISVWNVVAGERLRVFTAHDGPVFALTFAPAGADGALRLATGGADNTVGLWDAASGATLHRFNLPDAPVTLAFSPDGAFVAAGAYDTVHVWDVQSGAKDTTLKAEPGAADNMLAFAPGGKRLLAAAGTGDAVHLWMLAASSEGNLGKDQQAQLKGHGLGAFALAFLPGGDLVATTSFDGPARLWRLDDGEMVGEMGDAGTPSAAVALVPAADDEQRHLLVVDAGGVIQVWALTADR